MRTRHKKLSAAAVGFTMLLAACSGEGDVPEALAFQDDTSSDPAPPAAVNSERPDISCSSSDFSIPFDASTVLIDPNTSTLGPFTLPVALPAGNYDVTVATWYGPVDEAVQTMEQWRFVTDSGFTSPLTDDFSSPTNLQSNQSFDGVDIPATTQIFLEHKGNTGVTNSVHPLCIGFELNEPVVTTTTTEAPATTTTTAAPVVTTTTAAPVVTTTTAAPAVSYTHLTLPTKRIV